MSEKKILYKLSIKDVIVTFLISSSPIRNTTDDCTSSFKLYSNAYTHKKAKAVAGR